MQLGKHLCIFVSLAQGLLSDSKLCELDMPSATPAKLNQPFDFAKNYGLLPCPASIERNYDYNSH
ncbi:hypothetical protein GCM10007414_37900 [Agarivorans gilvus]|uniref:Uncharacterized protein n=1 Tax=Agarivorans gilvus TaxID=680279 RepID=A0ABQ1I875_9ALTE|nr:hypothetical protein GCM10007414_37900 [Agarivorans gilvus]